MPIFKVHRRLQRKRPLHRRYVAVYVALLLAAALIMAWPMLARSITGYDHYLYFVFTGEPVSIGWDAVAGADSYQWRLRHVQNDAVAVSGQTATTQVEVYFPKIGIWAAEVRAVKQADPVVYSDWAQSIDSTHATVDGQAKGWWVSSWLAPAGGVEID